ncbi:MAG: leucyl/phenylalanyl-tRNA--protein transferase [Burkholderiaceae bacterium]
MQTVSNPLRWLAPGDPLPPLDHTWGEADPIPGLLAAGGSLDVDMLLAAYGQAAFPWFSDGQPILWWSPDPRMVLNPGEFRLHRSLRQSIARFNRTDGSEVRFDSAFDAVIRACAASPREGQSGTWIGQEMVAAYQALHRAGYAHSVETWVDGELVAGLYCVAIGRAVFGESMFTTMPDGSKIALAALVAFCRAHGVERIDCQQNTPHLASLGAREMPRADFAAHVEHSRCEAALNWHFDCIYWNQLSALSYYTPRAIA